MRAAPCRVGSSIKALVEESGNIARAMHDHQHLDAALDGTVENHVRANGQAPDLRSEVRAGLPHVRLRGRKVTRLVDAR